MRTREPQGRPGFGLSSGFPTHAGRPLGAKADAAWCSRPHAPLRNLQRRRFMAAGNGVWGIDVGQCGLKAVKLRPAAEEGKVELVAFDFIEHPKILSQPDAEPEEIIKAALEKFVSRNEWQKDQFVIGVPGQQTFARFCKLPPVEPKKLPDLVKFEAAQQIPFSMDEVVWDYQVFQATDSPDVEVGIFAMRKDLIRKYLDYFDQLGVAPIAIQTIPSALYNFCQWDAQGAGENGATVLIDVGAQNTDLIVVESNSAWYRNIPLGGNSFTEALVKAFKLSFAKAENLKRTAADSKYARQVFQAMRPIFSDLVAEIQRSLGFYSSTHRDVELKQVLACGNAFRLPGLQKYLENNLTLDGGVAKLESFNKLVTNATTNAPQFTENLLSFGPAYGLAVQGLGMAPISANLLPPELARIALWNKKRTWFIAAAACFAGAAAMPWMRFSIDNAALASSEISGQKSEASRIVKQAQTYQKDFAGAQSTTGEKKDKLDKLFELQKDRALVPILWNLVHAALPDTDPAIRDIRSPDEFKKKVAANPGYARTNRKEMLIDSLSIKYVKNIDAFTAPADTGMGGMATPFNPQGTPTVMGDMDGPRGSGRESAGTFQPESPAAPAGGDATATAPGFYVTIHGRLLYGGSQDAAVGFFDQKLFPDFKKTFSAAGLPFYIPDEDAMNVMDGKKNLRYTNPMKVKDTMPAAAYQKPVAPPRPGEQAVELPPVDPDPLTGEERATDWRVTIGFKVKMGEKPPAPPADPNAKPPGKP
jgi:type IV pilus assembly protein PilM